MKQIIAILALFAFAISSVSAKGDRASAHETVKGNHISVTYSRPNKKGREIFGKLVPYGEVWRTGADEATEITFDKDGVFAGQQIKAGTYTLFTIPGKEQWTIILNKHMGQWGSFEYDKWKNEDVLKATVKPNHVDKVLETFTIKIENGLMKLDWDQTSVLINTQF